MIRICLVVILMALIQSASFADAKKSEANRVSEWTFMAAKEHEDPFNELTLDVVFTDPQGATFRVPGFWDGKKVWKVRYASPTLGKHHFKTECSDTTDAGLNGIEGDVEITAYDGDNGFYKHGPVRIAADKRHFEHADGTPFFWLGDTWWMGLCSRMQWPADVKKLGEDRKEKGFNVIQIVAGLYPDMHPFDPRGANEAGYPWEKEYARINPAYFDEADKRLMYLADEGLSPCIVGAWGYFLPWMGVDKMKQHWRYLIARYGAMPVTWCAAGEANLNWYLAKPFPIDDREQVTGWTDVMRSIHAVDPFHRPLTIHPTGLGRLSSRHATDDVELLDFDMLQTPHGQREAVVPTQRAVQQSYDDKPVMPVINGEAAYERLMDVIGTEWTRQMFWQCLTNGAAGHTYGANGIWQVNRKGKPHGPSPHHPPGSTGYGIIPWDEAMNLGGSSQVGYGKKLFTQYEWWKLTPRAELASYAEENVGAPMKWGQWIWHAADGDSTRTAPVEKRWFFKTIELPAGATVTSAALQVSADDHFVATLNGQRLGESTGSDQPKRFDIASMLKPGKNEIVIEAENLPAPVKDNPAALIVGGEVATSDGKTMSLASDDTWQSSKTPDGEHAGVRAIGAPNTAPWAEPAFHAATLPIGCVAIEGKLRIVYVPESKPITLTKVDAGGAWSLSDFNVVTGKQTDRAMPKIDSAGSVKVDPPQDVTDWVIVLKR